MELNAFIRELEISLVRRGIPPEVANRHVITLQRTFTEDDLREIAQIQSTPEVDEIAENIALILTKNKIKSNAARQAMQRPAEPAEAVVQQAPVQQSKPPLEKMPARPVKQAPPADELTWLSETEDMDYFEEADDNDKTKKGFCTFWGIFVVTLPLTLLLAAAYFGLFFGVFAVLTAMIIGLVVGVIALVAAGAAVSLVGIIYGVTQLFSFPAAGLFEIGIGVIAVGAVMFASIVVYNIALRFLPWVMGKVAKLLKFTCGKLRDLFLHLRRECYKL